MCHLIACHEFTRFMAPEHRIMLIRDPTSDKVMDLSFHYMKDL
jgi:hypothetical protein